MKKILFLLAAAACAACSMDETTEIDRGLPIDFRTAVATRATVMDLSALEAFKVMAFYSGDGSPFFKEEETITLSGEESSKTGNSTYYWPSDDSELTFYAYAPTDLSSKGGKVIMTDKESSTIEYEPDNDIKNQIDLITAMATGKRSKNEDGVELSFQHALSQIEVQADYANAEDGQYNIIVAGVKIGNVVGSATYRFNAGAGYYGSWESDGEVKSYEVEYEGVSLCKDPQSIMGSDGTWMLIPQQLTPWDGSPSNTGTYLAAYIKITTKDGYREVYPATEDRGYGWAAVGIDTDWKPNHKYTYTLKFTDDSAGTIPPDPDNPGAGKPVLGKPIKFTVTVDEWEDDVTDVVMNKKE